ncbi:hypothetical protein [Pseudoteredinibacter isoporae]|uniref:hypothetical protein n=1 Tax=Pseudoteredinibacter isoporae TaxID=570281 RepID=UPI003340E458
MKMTASELQTLVELTGLSCSAREQIFEEARYACFRKEGMNRQWLIFNWVLTLVLLVVSGSILTMLLGLGLTRSLLVFFPVLLSIVMFFIQKARHQRYLAMVRPFLARALRNHNALVEH